MTNHALDNVCEGISATKVRKAAKGDEVRKTRGAISHPGMIFIKTTCFFLILGGALVIE